MIRLLLAIGLASALWPVDDNNETLGVRGINVSSADILSAAHSVYEDLGDFCNRNTETCLTGKQVFYSVSANVRAQVLDFQSGTPTSSSEELSGS